MPATLILLRHAKSDWSGDEPDIRRPLAERGRRQAPAAGRWLDANVDAIDLALVSPATRARQTWDLVSEQLRTKPPARIDDRLYAASARELLAVVRELPPTYDTVVVVGHNPGLEDLASVVTGDAVSMPTSALAVMTWPGAWSAAGRDAAILRAWGRPPEEGRLGDVLGGG
jgi:phosphohistidine phosphatase